MILKRMRVFGKSKPGYPDVKEMDPTRRAFLRQVGGGILGASLLGLGACDEGKVEPAGSDVAVPDDVPEYELGGVAPNDMLDRPDVTGRTDTEQWELAGGMREPDEVSPPDVTVDPDWTTGGVAPPPDEISPEIVEHPDVKPDGGDVPPLPGEMPEPDVWNPDVKPDVADVVEEDVPPTKDVEEDMPPLAGDMPAPRSPRKRR